VWDGVLEQRRRGNLSERWASRRSGMSDFFGLEIPFAEYCGVEALSRDNGLCRIRVSLQKHHENSLGMGHGGVILTLLDIALGAAARSVAGENARVMTIDMHVAFLSRARGKLTAEGRVVRNGKSLIFCEGEVKNADGALIAKATGLFKPIERGEIAAFGGGDG
jgi:uncharacterized protein (TIGR00369 family)